MLLHEDWDEEMVSTGRLSGKERTLPDLTWFGDGEHWSNEAFKG